MSDKDSNESNVDSSTSESEEEQALQLRRDADLAAHLMLTNEGARIANLSDESRKLVAAGLAERLEIASNEHGLDVAELRYKLELSKAHIREDGYEL